MCNDDQDYIDSLEEDAIEFDSKLDALRKELAEVKAERDELARHNVYFVKDNGKLIAERDRYLNTFMHTHVAGRDGYIDKCHKCGLDLRDPVHRRNNEQEHG